MAPPRSLPAIAAALTVAGALLGTGCGSGSGGTAAAPSTTAASPPATTPSAAGTGTLPAPATTPTRAAVPRPPAPPVQVDEADGRDRGGVGGGHGGDTPVQLPPGWPADLYLPPGSLQSAQGAPGHWTAMLLVSGDAQRALEMAERYFRSAGYTRVRSGVLQRGARRVTVVTENLDHSDARTTLVVSADG